jgi:hypothetical protein
MKLPTATFFLAVAIGCLIVTGCMSTAEKPAEATLDPAAVALLRSNYATALADATNSIPYAIDFVRLFRTSASFFSCYTGVVGPSILNMQSDFYDRYELTMQIPVTLDDTRRKVISFGEPQFTLLEISQVGKNANGQMHVSFSAEGLRRFGASEWNRIVDAGGDFSAIGCRFTTNRPVFGFNGRNQ